MKLITLLILTATLNITLLNKNNCLIENRISTMIEEINNNHDILSDSKKVEYIDSIKQKLLTHLKKYGTHIVKILIKTHIITIKDTKPTQNITLKPEPSDLKTGQQI